MNASDDFTVPLVRTEGLSAAAKELINRPREKMVSLLVTTTPPLPVDHPQIADAVQSLEAEFAVPESERVYFEELQVAKRRSQMAAVEAAPRNFLQAHMVIIEALLINPGITTTALSAQTGYTRNWLHKIMSADAFQAKLAEKQKAYCDPIILNAIKDRLNGVVSRSLEIMEERMDNDKVSLENALAVFTAGSKALGLGVQKAAPTQQQFIVHMPAPGMGAKDWAAAYSQGADSSGSGATEMTQTIEAASSSELGDLSTVGAVVREVADDN